MPCKTTFMSRIPPYKLRSVSDVSNQSLLILICHCSFFCSFSNQDIYYKFFEFARIYIQISPSELLDVPVVVTCPALKKGSCDADGSREIGSYK